MLFLWLKLVVFINIGSKIIKSRPYSVILKPSRCKQCNYTLYYWKRNKANKRTSLTHSDFFRNKDNVTGSTEIPQKDFTD